jgi:hypothetical protein
MVRKFAVSLLAVVCLVVGAASAQEALRVSPSTFNPGDESFLTIFIQGLVETDVVTVTFNGPVGPMSLEPSYLDPNQIIVFVPGEITNVEGTYSVDVYVVRNAETFHFGPGHFAVAVPPPPDNPPVLINAPEVVVAEAAEADGAVVYYLVSTNDGTPVTCTRASGTLFPIGATPVQCTANNGHSSATVDFTIFVIDTVAPSISGPDDIVSESPIVSWTITASDAIDPNPTIVCSVASGTSFPAGTVTVNCFAFDFHNNYAFHSFDVTVTNGLPVLTVPDNINVEATSPNGAVVTFTATATDGATVTCTPPSGSTFPIGTTTVSCTATNPAGSDTEVFQVRVRDTIAPILINVTANPNALWPPDRKMVPVTVSALAIDAGDASPTVTITGVTSNQPVNDVGDGNTSPDWEITGPLTVNLRAERSGSQDRIYTITIQATDDSGNSSTATLEVLVTQSRRRR